MFKNVIDWFGIEPGTVSHRERLVSIAGGFLGVLLVYLACLLTLGAGHLALVASIGASAVLLFGVPHGAMSQPWAFAGGQLISALAGVAVAKLVAEPMVAIPLSVAVSIGLMHYLRCMHPPGGATSLFAVIGGPQIQAMGFGYVIEPVLLNVVLLLIAAVAYNALFPWRRYPARRVKIRKPAKPSLVTSDTIEHADLVYALSQVDSIIDVTEHDLLRIYDLATQRHRRHTLDSTRIRLGQCYTNGKFGEEWSVRQIVDESRSEDPEKDKLIYKVVAGQGRRSSGVCTRQEFARWAQDQVERQEYYWQKVSEKKGTDLE